MINATANNPDIPEQDLKKINRGIAYACRLLGVREYSVKTLSLKLKHKCYQPREISNILAFLLENNWLSDRRFCESFIRSRHFKGQGLSRIRYELTQSGISEPLIEESLESLSICWQQVCDQTTEKKMSRHAGEFTLKARQKLERFLNYRGFSNVEIRSSINKYLK